VTNPNVTNPNVTNPNVTNPNVTVATAAIRQEATTWDEQSVKLQALQAKVEGLRLSGLEAGIFGSMVRAYTQVVNVVSGRCGEGAQRTSEIASALRQVADIYDAEEEGNVHRLTGLY
jgi:hypothetical protein